MATENENASTTSTQTDAPAETAAEQQELPNDVAALQQLVRDERQRAESNYASWQRSAADFANYRRRTEQERSDSAKFANAMLILNILPILDDLERALNSVSTELAGFTWIDGIRLIHRKLAAVLESQGVAPIEAVGQRFDPALHEAVSRAPGEEGKVLSELQRGYTLHGRVIRPSLVVVGEGTAQREDSGTSGQEASES